MHSDALLRTLRLSMQNLALAAAILIFAKGFFPHKAVLPGLAQWPTDTSVLDAAPFDRVIFMVVDALRSDFVYGLSSNFTFTQSLIRAGSAIPFTGHASPPTITMPRVKALTTGSVPSFIDLVLNFDESDTSSTLAAQDSWLAQLRAKPNGKIVMYGDDTWLRLFPNFFDRADGTTSFFVSDFTEVDNNVTRHVPTELAQEDWNGMVMHFLGLDHIGHKTGPRGPNMPAKQREMDLIVKQIYEAMEKYSHLQSSLLVLLGDHGMNEGGNHGANSAGEVSTALTFISPKFKAAFNGLPSPAKQSGDFKYYDVVDQSDVAPTLAALLGFPIPKNSLGAIIPKMLTMWTNNTDRYSLLYQNAQQIQHIAHATYPEAFDSVTDISKCMDKDKLTDPQKLACKWLTVQDLHESLMSDEYMFLRDGTPLVHGFLKEAQGQLSGSASQYDEKLMLAAIVMTVVLAWPSKFTYNLTSPIISRLAYFFILFAYSATMFASSYVEEEHQFWYWVTSAWLVILSVQGQRIEQQNQSIVERLRNVATCCLFAIIRRWNQTGQKYAGEADFVTEIFTKSPWLLWVLIFVTYSIVPRHFRTRLAELNMKQLAILPVLVAASALLFKLAFTAADAPELLQGMSVLSPVLKFVGHYQLTSLARVVFLGLANLFGLALYIEKPWMGANHMTQFLARLHDIVSLFLITQSRTANIPIFLLFHLQVTYLRRGRTLHAYETILTMLMLQYSSFFAFGGTNAISSVDLSNAYNGVKGYNVLAVGLLTFLSNWAGPVWWTSATACVLASNTRWPGSSNGFDMFGVLTHFAVVHAAAVMLACYVLREHLFVWTVFSPKYLYMMAWTFGQHMVVNGLLCCIISASGY